MATIHEPVLLKEVIDYLEPGPGKNYIDCTFGGGGHSLEILSRVKPEGKVVGIDWDPAVVKNSSNENLILINDNYKNLKKIYQQVRENGIERIDGILLDLGLSSDQLGSRDRGFSFNDGGILDLRFNTNSDILTAADILANYSQQELFKIFNEYGEDPLAWKIAKEIVEQRNKGNKIETVEMLVQLVSNAYKRHFKSKSKKNPATRIFQALRIAVNDELGNIKSVLPQAIDILNPGGRIAIISFHSLEDRIVKNYFRDESKRDYPRLKLVTKKPIVASEEEISKNPRSRSAKLRVAEKI